MREGESHGAAGGPGLALAGGGSTATAGAVVVVMGVPVAVIGSGIIMQMAGQESAQKNADKAQEATKGDSNTGNTKHGDQRLKERGFTDEKVTDIKENYSQKVYQEGDKTVYAKKNGNYYDVIITNADGEIVTAVGGNTKSLKTWKDVTKMLNNNGGYSTLPY